MKLSQSRETFSFTTPNSIEGCWLIRLTSLEVYVSIFNITEENNKFELCRYKFDEFSFTELKEELQEVLDISIIPHEHLPDRTIRRRIIKASKKLEAEKRRTEGYHLFLLGYSWSPFRESETYLRFVVGLDEDDFQLFLKQYKSNFVTHETSPGVYPIKDISEVAYTMGDHKGTLQNKK